MLYQTTRDKVNERRIARQIALIWGLEIVEQEPLCPFDFKALTPYEHLLTALVEIKRRNEVLFKYAGIPMDVCKWQPFMQLADAYGVPPVFVAEYNGGVIVSADLRAFPDPERGQLRRNDRPNEPPEPVVYFPLVEFLQHRVISSAE